MPLLLSELAPNWETRAVFQAMALLTRGGQLISGFIEHENPTQAVLRASDGQTHTIDREEIETFKSPASSLMPEGLLDGLTSERLIDLLAYLRSSQPLNDGTEVYMS